MKLFIQLAIRNVHRNMRNSILNGMGIALTVILILFILALSRGIEMQIVERNIRFETGAVQIDFKKDIIKQGNIQTGDSIFQVIEELLAQQENITSYRPRIYPTPSILYSEENETERIKIHGISKEDVSLLQNLVTITEGSFNPDENSKGILISNGLTEDLGLKIGSTCQILQQTIDGMINMEEFIITGIFRYTSQINKNLLYLDYDETKSLYNCNLPSKLLIDLTDKNKATEVKEFLAGNLTSDMTIYESEKIIDSEYVKISTYTDHMGNAQAIATINRYGMGNITFFLMLISFVGIWSMQSENIHKRKKEIGTLLSFGFRKNAIKRIFLFESIYISLVFMSIGILFILFLISLINLHNGIFLGDLASFAFGSAIVNPQMKITDFLFTGILAISYPFVATYLSMSVMNKCNIINLLKQF